MTTDVVIAVDVGGTSMKCAVIDATGQIRHAERHPTGARGGPEAVVTRLLDVLDGLAGKARADGLHPLAAGVTVPGVVDEVAGVATWSANVGFRDVPLAGRIRAHLGLPTALGHDMRAGGLAEARLGAGRGTRHLLFVAIGTGIAAANVVDGRVDPGAHGAAGELGHVVVRPGGPTCGCGGRGCLEAVASAAAVARRYTELAPASGATALDSTTALGRAGPGGPPVNVAGPAVSAADVAALAGAGDPTAGTVWREVVDALADGLLTAQSLYDPEVVVLGGGLAEAGETLLGPLRTALRDRLTFQREPRLVRATLGDEAGCLGAALLAFESAGQGWTGVDG